MVGMEAIVHNVLYISILLGKEIWNVLTTNKREGCKLMAGCGGSSL